MRKNLILCLWLSAILSAGAMESTSALYKDTLVLNGPNLDHLSEFATYWVDKSGSGSLSNALMSLDSFQHWEIYTSLNVGLNPYPLWLHLTIRNDAKDSTRYWWSLYSHADSVVVFRNEISGWIPIDTVLFSTPYAERKVSVRFLATELKLGSEETVELLMKVRNLRKPHHSFTDITTPDHNLQWEKKFFWSTGIFLGFYMMIMAINMIIGLITNQKVFYLFSAYILILSIVILQEEFFIVLYPNREWFNFFMRFPSMGLTIVGCGLHFYAIKRVIGKNDLPKTGQLLERINMGGLMYGIIISAIYFFYKDQIHLGQSLYLYLWYVSVGVIIMMMLTLSLSIILGAKTKLQFAIALMAAFWIFYFNAAGYYLNYEGVITYYVITYPNYFYWGLCVEFMAFGFILAWRYQETLKKNFNLLNESSMHQTELLEKEIEIQERERKQIARDLHDDLGATISAIKLIITNNYSKDDHLVKMMNKASADLRIFSGTFSAVNLKNGLFETVSIRISELNLIGKLKFTFIADGVDNTIEQDLALSMFRIFSELVNNILKHSKATKATIQIIIDDEQCLIMTEDNGSGFDVQRTYAGMGLENIQQRASRFNGNVYTTSDKRSGTTTIITIPNHHTNENQE